MRTVTLRTLSGALAIFGLWANQFALAQSEPVISVVGPAAPVAAGSTFAVDVDISNTPDLYDFQFDLDFDSTILQATTVNQGTLLWPGGNPATFFPGFIDNTDSPGSVTFVADTLIGPPPGASVGAAPAEGLLATIDFTATNAGTSALSVDPTTYILQDSLGNLLTASIVDGSVTVQGVTTSISEPATPGLLGVGLLAASLARRRTRPQDRPSAGTTCN